MTRTATRCGIQGRPPGADPWGLGRQVVGDQIIKLVRHVGCGHGSTPRTGYTANQQNPCRQVVSEPLTVIEVLKSEKLVSLPLV